MLKQQRLLAAVAFLVLSSCSSEVTAPPPAKICVDADKDGADDCSDCNDTDPDIHPGAKEICGDGKDNNCDGKVDEGCTSPLIDAGGLPGNDAGAAADAAQPADSGAADASGALDGSTTADASSPADASSSTDASSPADASSRADAATTPDAGPGACRLGDPPRACGVAGSTCVQACLSSGLGPCQPSSGPIDTNTDARNCGQCGNVCPAPLNAAAKCVKGVCGRGPCATGFFDLDLASSTFGCESTCAVASCTDGAGRVTPITTRPLPESGAVFRALVSSSSLGGGLQTSASQTNMGSLGVPPAIEQKNAVHKHHGGFTGADRK